MEKDIVSVCKAFLTSYVILKAAEQERREWLLSLSLSGHAMTDEFVDGGSKLNKADSYVDNVERDLELRVITQLLCRAEKAISLMESDKNLCKLALRVRQGRSFDVRELAKKRNKKTAERVVKLCTAAYPLFCDWRLNFNH